jgi:hypothetical protein
VGVNHWDRFIKSIKKRSLTDDQNLIFIDKFEHVLEKYKVEITKSDKDRLMQAFPGHDDGIRKSINVSKLYEMRINLVIKRLYQKVDVHENDGEDDPVDISGYTG